MENNTKLKNRLNSMDKKIDRLYYLIRPIKTSQQLKKNRSTYLKNHANRFSEKSKPNTISMFNKYTKKGLKTVI